MNVDELLTKARDAVHVSRVYGEPFEKNGVTVIPAAKVAGGGGGGTGHDETRGDGEGGGLGMAGRPAGAFVIKGDQVTWRPAVDANRVISHGRLRGRRLPGDLAVPDPGPGSTAQRLDLLSLRETGGPGATRPGCRVSPSRPTTGR